MLIKELIGKLQQENPESKVSVASDEHMDIVFDEICVDKLNGKLVLFGLEGSEDF